MFLIFSVLTSATNFTLTTETSPDSMMMDNNQNDIHVDCNGTCLPNSIEFVSEVRNFDTYSLQRGYAVAQLVEALRYKPKDRGFDSR
jgi:hypothetical protein